jgi:hypothetical protein
MQFVVAPLAATALVTVLAVQAPADLAASACGRMVDQTLLSRAQRSFYNGQYEQTAELTGGACEAANSLALCELRTSALLFRIKQAIGQQVNKDRAAAWRNCASCPQLLAAFIAETTRGQTVARATLRATPDDDAARFLLAKLGLNYVWLQLGVLGRKTGWGQYWEARHSVDAVLADDPSHLRARVARAWIDYIVDTRMPFGTRWVLGGGNKQRGLLMMRQAATADGDFYARAEAGFALWDVQIREKQVGEAVLTARRLACDFPDNEEIQRFLQKHDTNATP